MNSNWAEENLQVIRTLMERAALYRRALAPIMLFVGGVGVVAGIYGDTDGGEVQMPVFARFWFGMAAICLIGTAVLVRRQAFLAGESFWSPPARRVAFALCPGLLAGAFFGLIVIFAGQITPNHHFTLQMWSPMLPQLWMICYGLALTSAGFFVQRGFRLLGWIFLLSGFALIVLGELITADRLPRNELAFILSKHWMMGLTFGGLHLLYGAYLYFTEKKELKA